MNKIHFNKEYIATLMNEIPYHTEPGTEIAIELDRDTESNIGFLILDKSDPVKEEVIFYHRKVGNTVYTYGINRDNPVEHDVRTQVLIANSISAMNYLSDNTFQQMYIYKVSDKQIFITGGKFFIDGHIHTINDLKTARELNKTLISDTINYIYIKDGDYFISSQLDNSLYQIGEVRTNNLGVIEEIKRYNVFPISGKVLDEAALQKLAGIEEGAEVNVQVDWEQTNNTKDDYIKNKPNLFIYEKLTNKTNDLSSDSTTQYPTVRAINRGLENKVDKESGKGLSSNDFTDEYINKIEGKVDKEVGKGLSSNDFTTPLKQKLESLEAFKGIELQEGNNILITEHNDTSGKKIFAITATLADTGRINSRSLIKLNPAVTQGSGARLEYGEWDRYVVLPKGGLTGVEGSVLFPDKTNRITKIRFHGINKGKAGKLKLQALYRITSDTGVITDTFKSEYFNIDINEGQTYFDIKGEQLSGLNYVNANEIYINLTREARYKTDGLEDTIDGDLYLTSATVHFDVNVSNIEVVNSLDSDSEVLPLSAKQGKVLKELIDSLGGGSTANIIIVDDLNSDDTDKALSAKQGKVLKELIDNKPDEKVEVINNLNSDDTDKALSAKQGKELKTLIDNKSDEKVEVIDNLNSTDVDKALSANQGKELKELIESRPAQSIDIVDNLNSTDTDKALSANQGKALNDRIDGLSQTGPGTAIEIVNNLTSTDTNKALSANQGKVLKDLIDTKPDETIDVIDNVTSTDVDKALSANQGKVLKELIDNKPDETVDIIDNVTSVDTDKALSANQGKVLKDLIDDKPDNWDSLDGKPTEFPPSSHTHTESDIIDLDKYKKSEVDRIINDLKIDDKLNQKLNTSDVIDNLTSEETSKALSAKQGKELKDIIDSKEQVEIIDNITSTDTDKALSANQGKVLKEMIENSGGSIDTTNLAKLDEENVFSEENTFNNIAIFNDVQISSQRVVHTSYTVDNIGWNKIGTLKNFNEKNKCTIKCDNIIYKSGSYTKLLNSKLNIFLINYSDHDDQIRGIIDTDIEGVKVLLISKDNENSGNHSEFDIYIGTSSITYSFDIKLEKSPSNIVYPIFEPNVGRLTSEPTPGTSPDGNPQKVFNIQKIGNTINISNQTLDGRYKIGDYLSLMQQQSVWQKIGTISNFEVNAYCKISGKIFFDYSNSRKKPKNKKLDIYIIQQDGDTGATVYGFFDTDIPGVEVVLYTQQDKYLGIFRKFDIYIKLDNYSCDYEIEASSSIDGTFLQYEPKHEKFTTKPPLGTNEEDYDGGPGTSSQEEIVLQQMSGGGEYAKLSGDNSFHGEQRIFGKTFINPRTQYGEHPHIDLAIGDTDTGFKWVEDGVLQSFLNNVLVAEWRSYGIYYKKEIRHEAPQGVDGNAVVRFDTIDRKKIKVLNESQYNSSSKSGDTLYFIT